MRPVACHPQLTTSARLQAPRWLFDRGSHSPLYPRLRINVTDVLPPSASLRSMGRRAYVDQKLLHDDDSPFLSLCCARVLRYDLLFAAIQTPKSAPTPAETCVAKSESLPCASNNSSAPPRQPPASPVKLGGHLMRVARVSYRLRIGVASGPDLSDSRQATSIFIAINFGR